MTVWPFSGAANRSNVRKIRLVASISAPSVVTRRPALGPRLVAHGFEFLRRAEAPVGLSLGEQSPGGFRVDFLALGLAVGAFVPVDPQPCEPVQNLLDGLLGGALPVGVLDPENVRSSVVPGEKTN